MKRVLAMLLTGCLLLQSLPVSVLSAQAADMGDIVIVPEDAGIAEDVPAESQDEAAAVPPQDAGGSGAADSVPVQDGQAGENGPSLEDPTSQGAPMGDPGAEGDGGGFSDVLISDVEVVEEDPEAFAPQGDETTGQEDGPTPGSGQPQGMEPSSGETPQEMEPSFEEMGLQNQTVEEPSADSLDRISVEPGQQAPYSLIADPGKASAQDEGVVRRAQTQGGRLDVELVSEIEIPNATVSLHGEAQSGRTATVSVPGDGTTAVARIDGIAEGTYTVTVKADRFASYSQEIKIEKDETAKIKISTARVESASGAKTMGWMRAGDVTGDGKITEDDVEVILRAIAQETYSSACDFVSDGSAGGESRVDLADLQYVVQNLPGEGETEQLSAVEYQTLPKSAKVDDGTQIEGAGSIDNLLENKGGVSLKPAAGGKISDETPVGMSIALADEGEEVPEIGGMTIQAPAEQDSDGGKQESNIAAGSLEFYYEKNGEEYKGTIQIGEEGTQTVISEKQTEETETESGSSSPAGLEGPTMEILSNGNQQTETAPGIGVTEVPKVYPGGIEGPGMEDPSIVADDALETEGLLNQTPAEPGETSPAGPQTESAADESEETSTVPDGAEEIAIPSDEGADGSAAANGADGSVATEGAVDSAAANGADGSAATEGAVDSAAANGADGSAAANGAVDSAAANGAAQMPPAEGQDAETSSLPDNGAQQAPADTPSGELSLDLNLELPQDGGLSQQQEQPSQDLPSFQGEIIEEISVQGDSFGQELSSDAQEPVASLEENDSARSWSAPEDGLIIEGWQASEEPEIVAEGEIESLLSAGDEMQEQAGIGDEVQDLDGAGTDGQDSFDDGEGVQDLTDSGTPGSLEEGTDPGQAYALQTTGGLAPIGADPTASQETLNASVKVEPDGSLVFDFGAQIAVKRVTIKITRTKKETPLVEIAKVEFVNNMEDRIPEPELNIPSMGEIGSGNKELTVEWTAQTNVTGYEVFIEGETKKAGMQSQTVRVSDTRHRFVSINDQDLKNFKKYTIKVRSVNGTWTSPWSEEKIGIPKPSSVPDGPDNVKTEEGFRAIRISWKDMDDSDGYMVYYKKEGGQFAPVVSGFTQAEDGTGRLLSNSYMVTGLEDDTVYELYVVGWNDIGWGKESLHATQKTSSGKPPQLPSYRLINTPNGEGELTAHIKDAIGGHHNGAHMVQSPLDEAEGTAKYSAFGVVDNNYSSYWTKTDWDDGVSYPVSDFSKGLTVTLDEAYEMNYLTFTAADIKENPERASIVYWENWSGTGLDIGISMGATVIRKLDENGYPYYVVKFDHKVKANRIQLYLGRGYGNFEIKVAEIRYHAYDELYDDVMKLYADEMHTVLVDTVTDTVIDALEARLEAGENGEKHPLYDSLKLELKTARELLADKDRLFRTVEVDSRITAKKDGHLGFGGLNPWQPLGIVATAGDTLVVYVGHNMKNAGENSNLRLVFTQYHAQSDRLMSTSGVLKVGRNELTVPNLSTTSTDEWAGQVYVYYDGNNEADKYGVRVLGGEEIPVLNLYKKDEAAKKQAALNYVEELEAYVGTIQQKHEQIHQGSDNKNANRTYQDVDCALNATDLMMDYMMYSVPALQVWKNLERLSDPQERADQLLKSLDAVESAMRLFYHHKGLSDEKGGKDALPSQHLNIRYMRMFSGAFMYASGNHIGIEYPQTNIVSGAGGMESLGWGIAHEIGHDINQGTYAIAEVTNNYFAQLLTIKNIGTRFQYPAIYEKVTSGAIGRSPNVGTQLGLYWQLHLAFDNQKDDQHIYSQYQEQFDNLFFARVDSYSRDPSKMPNAPKDGWKLNAGVDQNLMRLACAAAGKNILAFFEHWGMVPDAETRAYAEKFTEETKALWYVNDGARDYRVEYSADGSEPGNIAEQDVVSATFTTNGNQVTLELSAHDASADVILGYEITREMYADGKKSSQVVGFVSAQELNEYGKGKGVNGNAKATFVDTVSAVDNRVLHYSVKAVDMYLNYSIAAAAVKDGKSGVKIETGGALDKKLWTVETTMTSNDDSKVSKDENDPDSGFGAEAESAQVSSIGRVIDGDPAADGPAQPYQAKETSGEITVDLKRVEQITAIQYEGCDLTSLSIAVSADGGNWIDVKKDYKDCKGCENGFKTVWFDAVEEEHRESWIGTYNARYVRLRVESAEAVRIQEINICGPSGDNIEFLEENGTLGIGILSGDFKYGDQPEDVIPEGSIVFTGKYRGNPAYNVVMLFDTEGNVIGGTDDDGDVVAGQVILATVPENGNLGTTSDGRWVYYIEAQYVKEELKERLPGTGIRAELYRVDNAKTLAGERVVSDTEIVTIPDEFPSIKLTGDKTNSEAVVGAETEAQTDTEMSADAADAGPQA